MSLLDWIAFAAGATGLLILAWDVVQTVLVPAGAGPVSDRWGRLVGGLPSRVPGHFRPAVRAGGGPSALVLSVLTWIVGLPTAWWLALMPWRGAIAASTSGAPADAGDLAYFVGYCFYTLGLGDLVPANAGGQAVTVAVAMTGLTVVTLAITYLMPLLGAVTAKRQLAAMLRTLNQTADDLGSDDDASARWLTERLIQHAWPPRHLHPCRHRAYPLLHYFRTARPSASLMVQLTAIERRLAAQVFDSLDDRTRRNVRLWQRSVDELVTKLTDRYLPVHESTDSGGKQRIDRLPRAVAHEGFSTNDGTER